MVDFIQLLYSIVSIIIAIILVIICAYHNFSFFDKL